MVTRTRHTVPTRRWASLWPVIAAMAITSGACASGGGVPRPFPGAALPPGTGGAPTEAVDPPPGRAEIPPESAPAGAFAGVVEAALAFRGVPYVNGGSDPSGFDCSGLVQYVFGRHGTPMPREVRDQYRTGWKVDRRDVQPGDLVFFRTVGRGASHVGVALGDGQFVHAPSSRGVVRVERYDGPYWSSRFVGARRVDGAAPAAHQGLPGTVRPTN
jgi:cell wall-associated NlpC family hydrolase